MFSRALDLEAWADVQADLEARCYTQAGPAFVVTGEHPQLGVVVAVQTMDPLDGIHLLSELPYADNVDRMLAEQDEAITAPIRALFQGRRRTIGKMPAADRYN